jgi:AAA15 family ATPase/GTPase
VPTRESASSGKDIGRRPQSLAWPPDGCGTSVYLGRMEAATPLPTEPTSEPTADTPAPFAPVTTVRIQNYKSVKDVEFMAKRVTIIVGKANTGKSNILEALGLFCVPLLTTVSDGKLYSEEAAAIIRTNRLNELFYNKQQKQEIIITASLFCIKIIKYNMGNTVDLEWKNNEISRLFQFNALNKDNISIYTFTDKTDFEGRRNMIQNPFRYYKYLSNLNKTINSNDTLLPLNGENLYYVVDSNQLLRKKIISLISPSGYSLKRNQELEVLELHRNLEEFDVLSLSYELLSDTIKRQAFYLAAIYSNRNAVICFEEPEQHTAPEQIVELAQAIAENKENQFFLVTHNPYLLTTLMDNLPDDEVQVIYTYYEDFQTKVRAVPSDEIFDIITRGDLFSNLDHLAPKRTQA